MKEGGTVVVVVVVVLFFSEKINQVMVVYDMTVKLNK